MALERRLRDELQGRPLFIAYRRGLGTHTHTHARTVFSLWFCSVSRLYRQGPCSCAKAPLSPASSPTQLLFVCGDFGSWLRGPCARDKTHFTALDGVCAPPPKHWPTCTCIPFHLCTNATRGGGPTCGVTCAENDCGWTEGGAARHTATARCWEIRGKPPGRAERTDKDADTIDHHTVDCCNYVIILQDYRETYTHRILGLWKLKCEWCKFPRCIKHIHQSSINDEKWD